MIDEQRTIREDVWARFRSKTCVATMSEDTVDALGWPLTLIWAGVVMLLASYLGHTEAQRWSMFFLGAGALVLIGVAIRLLVPAYRKPVHGALIWAGFLFELGTGSWGAIGSLILIAIGASVLWPILAKNSGSL